MGRVDEGEQAAITAAQQRLPPTRIGENRTRRDYRRTARWWELEARRGYESSARSLEYAANMRWAAEVVGLSGEGTWPEIKKRQGHGDTPRAAIPEQKGER